MRRCIPAAGTVGAGAAPPPQMMPGLLSIVDDLRWYADGLGAERWDAYARTNKWTFIQNLWHLTKEAKKMEAPAQDRVHCFIDRGKMCVGKAGELFSLFEYEVEE